jgi:minor extracellular serine protease Vpr
MHTPSSWSRRRIRCARWAALCASAVLAACGGSQDTPSSNVAPNVAASPQATALSKLSLPKDQAVAQRVDRRLAGAQGPVEVWVSFDEPSMAAWQVQRATALGLEAGVLQREAKSAKADAVAGKPRAETAESAALKTLRGEMSGQRSKLDQQHASFKAAIGSLGAEELGRVSVAHNAIALRLDAKNIAALASQSGVAKVRPVVHYKLNLAETVPYVGGTALQSRGLDGSGTVISIVDSGIDYTHRNLGGPGTVEGYAEAAGAGASDPKGGLPNALFPNSKVVGGFDFVGDQWSGGPGSPPRTEDPNPIDYWFHGTHVADIAGGAKGMAPGAKLLAVKACASVSGSCNGIALLKAMDFSLDPNGDGNTDDAADVINLSLGSDFGQPEDDLSFAAGNAVDLGVVVVAAGGNGGNVATVVGSPSTEAGVISVAQTQVPSARAGIVNITAPASIARTITELGLASWAPITTAVSGDVVFIGRGCPADPAAGIAVDDPYLSNPAGKVALIDRGACDFSGKVDRAARAGAKAVLIGLVTPEAPFPLGFVTGSVFVPTAMIAQANANAIKQELTAGTAVAVTLDAVSLSMSMVDSSARGPSNQTVRIKPEIGAPGGSVSADVGTGSGETPFGGTSGATPMVAGAAAQLLQAFPNRTPMQIKAMLMNTAFTEIQTDPLGQPGVLAPIARIGAGELRVDRAAATQLIAFNSAQKSASLSFGFQAVSSVGVFTENLRLRNFSNTPKQVRLSSSFRYEDDRANGAVRISLPPVLVLPPNGSVTIPVLMTIDARRLPAWTQDGADLNTAGSTFAANEFDGYIKIDDGSAPITVPWHVMPRKSSAVVVSGGGTTQTPIALINAGVQEATAEVFALTGTSKRVPNDELPQPGSNVSFTDLRAVGARLAEPGIVQFGISTFGRRSNTLLPSGYEVQIDVNRDGTPEYAIFNNVLFPGTGLVAVFVLDIATGAATPFFFVDADFYSGNMIFTAPLQAMGLTDSSTFDFTVLAFDNYFGAGVSDAIGPMTFTPDKPKFRVDGAITRTVAPGRSILLRSTAVAGGDTASPSQTGLLMMYRGNAGVESSSVTLRR